MTSQGRFDQGKVFGITFSIIGRNIGLWLGLAIIFSALPTLVVEHLVLDPLIEAAPTEPNFSLQFYAAILAAMLIALVLSSLLSASIVRATVEDMSGKQPSMGDSMRTALAVLLPTVALGVLTGIGVVIGLLALVVPGIVLWLRWAVAIPVLVQERLSVTASMARSATLTAGFRWPLFELLLILIIAAALIQWAIAMIEPLLGGWPGLFVAALIESVMSMIISTATAVSYVELRQIKEGTSVGELAEIFS